ncbi:uncharacterized protein PG986_010792 [Apiospora aurea]|uniref:Uncharacterized protein n=1 Tax=Apiospora aurea TaxID=335848 RepID=A0ABR1Q390_9PEZI
MPAAPSGALDKTEAETGADADALVMLHHGSGICLAPQSVSESRKPDGLGMHLIRAVQRGALLGTRDMPLVPIDHGRGAAADDRSRNGTVLATLRAVSLGAGTGAVYLSLDVDMVDPALGPGTWNAWGGRAHYIAGRSSCRRGDLKESMLWAANIVGVRPQYDVRGAGRQTALVAAQLA